MDEKTDPPISYDDLSASGLLTRTDRQYLLGQHEPTRERKVRNRLRKRIRTGLKDFALLAHELPAQDRQQIFADFTAQIPEASRVYREEELDELCSTLAFLYSAAYDVGLPFDGVLERAIHESHQYALNDPFRPQNVAVDINENSGVDIDEIREKLSSQTSLTEDEYLSLKRLLFRDTEFLCEQLEGVTLHRQQSCEHRQWTRGESIVAIARWISADIRTSKTDAELIHPEVLCELGFDNLHLSDSFKQDT